MSRRYEVDAPVRILVRGESTGPEVGTVRAVDLDGRPTRVLDRLGQTIFRAGEFEVLDRAADGTWDAFLELEEGIRELRVVADGAAELARDLGERSDEALLDEISGLLDRAKALAAEATDDS